MRLGIRTRLRQLGWYPQLTAQRGFAAAVSALSWRAWSIGCDGGQISKTGVAAHPLSKEWSERFLAALDAAPLDTIKLDGRRPGYFYEARPKELIHLNNVNEYRAVTPAMLQALREFLTENRLIIEKCLGHPWRVCSVRTFFLKPSTEEGGMHFDGWPPSIRKLFILPNGATRRTGTTQFKLRSGDDLVIDEPRPLWTIFENSRVQHALVPGEVARPTIELNIVPARKTSTEPFYCGINNWYPLFPWA
jgi:hypothetical protein